MVPGQEAARNISQNNPVARGTCDTGNRSKIAMLQKLYEVQSTDRSAKNLHFADGLEHQVTVSLSDVQRLTVSFVSLA